MKIWVNGILSEAMPGQTVLSAAEAAGYRIPSLCYMPDMPVTGHCGLCACKIAEPDNTWRFAEACHEEVSEGMRIIAYDAEIHSRRAEALAALLKNHDADCLTCFKSSQCLLQDYAALYTPDFSRPAFPKKARDESNPFYIYDPNKCVGCFRCVNICTHIQCAGVLEAKSDGTVGVKGGGKRGDTACVSCGNCVEACPVGALIPAEAHYNERFGQYTETVCPYCGVGCRLKLWTNGTKVTGITGAGGIPNHGLTCVKGRFAFHFINHPDRLKTPLKRSGNGFIPISWEEALTLAADAFNAAGGGESVAGLSSAKCSNEENYLFQKFMRLAAKTNNVDHCARLCHASTVAGLAYSFGSGAMTNHIDDIDKSEVIFIIGSNATEAHPVIGAALRRAKRKGARLIVAEPRRIDLAKEADIFLQIRPGTNVALLLGMAKLIADESLHKVDFINAYTEGFDEYLESLLTVDVRECARLCGIDFGDLADAARLFGSARTAAIYYAMGITQHSTGTDGVKSVANLAMLTGNVGRPGAGVNPLRGQNNVQGACDMGALPGDYSGYQKVNSDTARAKFSAAWGAELPASPGMTSQEMIGALKDGRLKVLYIMGENPLISDADLSEVEAAFAQNLKTKKAFIIVQDLFMTETAEYADLILPAACFAEKDGTVTNTERRVQLMRKAVPPPGEAREDWRIITDLADRLGVRFDYRGTDEIMDEIAALTPSYGGISHRRLKKGGIQWPCPDAEHPGTPILHLNGSFSGGKGRFAFCPYKSAKDVPDDEFPLILTTGRLLYQHHTRTMTGRTKAVQIRAGEPFFEIAPATALLYGIADGEKAGLVSPRGRVTAQARISDKIAPGIIFMPFHYAAAAANYLTGQHLDPIAKIPEFKVSKIRLEAGR